MSLEAFDLRLAAALGFLALFGGCIDWDGLYAEHCGDGKRSGHEQCDDGNTADHDGCDGACRLEAGVCGDGRTSGSEECDDANTNEDDACLSSCRAARCGDRQVWAAVEECDDGNQLNGDGCSDACRIERNLCGNHSLEGLEQCDDGNRVSGDGCSGTCMIEPPPELCGNGRLDPEEACDDGNKSNSDSCLNGCSVAACGDGFVWRGAEECDDGNSDNGDACTKTCLTCTDPNGAFFRSANGHCYTLHPTLSTVYEATAACDTLGGYLWSTTSAGEARDVNRGLSNGSALLWLSYRNAPSPPAWATGESTQYQAWAPGEPSDPNLTCTVQAADVDFNPLWRAAACTSKYGFVCETEPALLYALTHHAYRLHTRTRNWADARDSCVASGGHLLTVEDESEQTFLAKHFAGEIWLGAERVSSAGFQWVTGRALGYTAFAKNQPDDAGGKENCLVMTSSHAWNDIDCALTRRFVCEFE